MNSTAVASQEEAAGITAEFISNLDNLPNEVQYLLAELRHKETRTQEIQQDIQKETTRYIRHALRGGTPKDGKEKERENGKEKDTKDRDVLIPARAAADYAELDKLAGEKIALAERVVRLLTRVNARLDHDLARVVALSGEPAGTEHVEVRGGYVVSVTPAAGPAVSSGGGGGAGGSIVVPAIGAVGAPGVGGRGAVEKTVDSLRAAVGPADGSTGTAGASGGPGSHKRRRLNAGGAGGGITAPSRGHTPQGRTSRVGQQVHASPPRVRRAASSLGDEDADGEDDAEAEGDDQTEGGDAEDKELYCSCRKMSYGEMIACDNPQCAYQWFHLQCANLRPPLPESWYCADCVRTLGPGTERGRKGRRK